MKTKIFMTALIAVGLSIGFVSCSHETEIMRDDGIEWDGTGLDPRIVHLFTSVTPETRASSDLQSVKIENNRMVGITTSGGVSDQTNGEWKATNNLVGSSTTVRTLENQGSAVYFRGSNSVYVYAYHPHTSTNYSNGTVSFSVQQNQSTDAYYLDSDLLWAKATASVSNNPVTLPFTHKLAKVTVTLKPSDQVPDVSGATVSICGTKIATSLNTVTGDLAEASGDATDITMGTTEEDATVTPSTGITVPLAAITVPQTVAKYTPFIKIALSGGEEYYYVLPNDKDLLEGHSHNFILTVRNTELLCNYTLTAWEPVDENEASGTYEELYAEKLFTSYDATTGVVILYNDERLSSVITDEIKYNITSLTVVGNLNKDDIALLRDMAGYDGTTSTTTGGTLTELDLSQANIVGAAGTIIPYDGYLPQYAFANTKLKSIILPTSLVLIDSNAFTDCTALETVTIQENVSTIYDYAFSGCAKLSTIYCNREEPPYLTMTSYAIHSFENVASGCTVYVPNATAKAAYEAANGWKDLTIDLMP